MPPKTSLLAPMMENGERGVARSNCVLSGSQSSTNVLNSNLHSFGVCQEDSELYGAISIVCEVIVVDDADC
jgi:hypothetical protein